MTGPGDLHAVGFERSGFGCFFFLFFFQSDGADEEKKEAGFDVRNRACCIKEPKYGSIKRDEMLTA